MTLITYMVYNSYYVEQVSFRDGNIQTASESKKYSPWKGYWGQFKIISNNIREQLRDDNSIWWQEVRRTSKETSHGYGYMAELFPMSCINYFAPFKKGWVGFYDMNLSFLKSYLPCQPCFHQEYTDMLYKANIKFRDFCMDKEFPYITHYLTNNQYFISEQSGWTGEWLFLYARL